MKALLVVDMIHDFVYGKFGSEAAQSIIPAVKALIEKFDTVIYLKDAHNPDDPEIKVWGPHAMKGTSGSAIIPELDTSQSEIVEKTTYDGFFNTNLNDILKKLGVSEVYICGVATDICVMHTTFGAFIRGYNVYVVRDACAGTSQEAHNYALNYMSNIYGAKIVESDKI
ncbi:MAG: cysteine hydrolase [Euryarchaeota archaeon]|nr:cysteine hydrolase [Euryarchaeota archaeon]